MKAFLYAFFIVLLVGGGYYLLVDKAPAADTPAATWQAESQKLLTQLLADQLKIAQGQDTGALETDLRAAEAHLANAPAEADVSTFRTAVTAYRAQQNARLQAQP